MDQTKTLYIANYLELNNNVVVSVCNEGCDQILGVPSQSAGGVSVFTDKTPF